MRTSTEPGNFFAQIDIDQEGVDNPHGHWTFGVMETDEDGLSMTLHNHLTNETHHIHGITAENLDELNALTSLYRVWGSGQKRNSATKQEQTLGSGHRDDGARTTE
jgi:hypothetical protein